jgi:hypothetical protein
MGVDGIAHLGCLIPCHVPSSNSYGLSCGGGKGKGDVFVADMRLFVVVKQQEMMSPRLNARSCIPYQKIGSFKL